MATSSRARRSNKSEETPVTDVVEETVAVEENTETIETPAVEEEQPVSRIPSVLSEQAILNSICEKYLAFVDEIAAYNKEVLAAKDSEWNSSKVLERARAMGRPTDSKVEADSEIAEALSKWEDLVNQMNLAKRDVVNITANKLGISLTATSERDSVIEGPLKDKRNVGMTIGKQLVSIAELSADEASTEAVKKFLEDNPLPMVGRDQVTNFGESSKPTPKYRVTVEVKKGDEVLGTFDGFTKTAMQLSRPEYGYPRAKSLDAETLRKVWENAGNSAENTVQSTVTFEDDSVEGEKLTYTITKK